MKKIFIIGLILLSFKGIAQKMQDVVYLKNGSVIRGIVLEYSEDKTIKIETYDKSIWVFNSAEISKIEKQEIQKNTIEPNRKGYVGEGAIGTMVGRSMYGLVGHKFFRVVNSLYVTTKTTVGIGMELNNLENGLIPIFADVKYLFNEGRTNPYVNLFGGYSLPFKNQLSYDNELMYKGGVYSGAAIGIRHYISKRNALDFSIAYNFQKTTRNETYWWWGWEADSFQNVKIKSYYNRLALRIGLTF